jgi:hypothetical protein
VQIIRKNFGLKVLAFALAVIGWAYFRYETTHAALAARTEQPAVKASAEPLHS